MKLFKPIFFQTRLYIALFSIAGLFAFGYFIPELFVLAKVSLLLVIGLFIGDLFFLFAGRNRIECTRELPNRMSMGDANNVMLKVFNTYPFLVSVEVIDELPFQFQKRDFQINIYLKSDEGRTITYALSPKERGEFEFGQTNIYVSTIIGLVKRRFKSNKKEVVPVYPSFIQMRKYELLAMSNRMDDAGVKKVKKAGKHTEFDQVREYVRGDDYKLMNWKATAKRAHLMVNQYQEERSKDVYSIIDMGRVMKMPFEGMTLLDYAINSTLAISNISALKHDKAGLITFGTQINTFINAERRNNQMMRILEALYNQKTDFMESNYDLLYQTVKKRIRQRSLLILYTNFESLVSLKRHIAPLQTLATNHLVLVVVFQNTEIDQLLYQPRESLEDVYTSVIAEKFIYEKKLIVKELNKCGINAILTTPQNLTVNLINKYLEFKAGEKI